MKRFSGAAACLWMLQLSLPTSSPLAQAPDPNEIREILHRRIDEEKKSVGIVVGVLDANGPRIVGYGKLDANDPRTPDGDTVYEIGSISKVFTAILLQDMEDHSLLTENDPISKYLPEPVHAPTKDGQSITLLELADHTSGLPRLPGNLKVSDTVNPYASYTVEQMMDFLSHYELTRTPGAQYEYSNYGAALLGQILSRKSGKDFETMTIERICAPLGMNDTRIHLTPEQKSRFALGHGEHLEPVSYWDLPAFEGAGALRSTARDLLLLLGANLGLGSTPPELTATLARTQSVRHQPPDPNMAIGLGWHIQRGHGSEIVWHNGGTGGFRSYIGFDKARKLGVVVLSNSVQDIDDIGRHLLNSAYDLADKVRTAAAIDPKIYDTYVGYYQLLPSFVMHVTNQGGHLFLQATGQEQFEAFPETETDFFFKMVDAQISFVRDASGATTALILHQGGRDQKATRLGPDYQPPPEHKSIELAPELLSVYVGKYQLAPGIVLDVTLEGKQLRAQLTGQQALPIYPESETMFFYRVVEAQLEFLKDSTGAVTGLILHQGGVEQHASRLP